MKPKVPTHLFTLFIFLGYLTYPVSAFAQNTLSNSPKGSVEIFVYKLTRENLREIHLNRKEIDESMLHTFITSYPINGSTPELPKGNYVKVQVKENRVEYTDYTIDNFRYYNINTDERMMLFLTDSLGNIINNATVRYENKNIPFDNEMKVHNIINVASGKIIEINNGDVLHYIMIEKNTPRYISDYPKDDKGYIGFIILNKPEYRQGESIKFKVYLAKSDGTPYNEKISVYITERNSNIPRGRVMQKLEPYRPGLFEGEILLSTDMNLRPSLYDINVLPEIDIENRDMSTKITQTFQYEKFMLSKIVFSVKPNGWYLKNDPVKVRLNAVDQNDVKVEGKVEFVLRSVSNVKLDYRIKETFIPDTVWKCTYDMVGEYPKEIFLPDSVFIDNIYATYQLYATFISSQGERIVQAISISKDTRDNSTSFSIDGEFVRFAGTHNGNPDTDALIKSYSKDGTLISSDSIRLPIKIPMRWNVSDYEISTQHENKNYSVKNYYYNLIHYNLFREGNFVRLSVDNPAKIPFWYELRKGDNIIKRGYTQELDFSEKDISNSGYSVQLFYIFKDYVHDFKSSLPYYEKTISATIKADTIVRQGDRAIIEVLVTDNKGNPVKEADITAYAYKYKFGNTIPNVNIYKASNTATEFEYPIRYNIERCSASSVQPLLNWDEWKNRMRLDTIEYYKFIRPDLFYSYSELTEDGTTQISPYVVMDGDIHGVHILWIDGEPHFFKQAQQLKAYSFHISPGLHSLKMRTHDREVIIDSVLVKKGMKTIISTNGKSSGSYIDDSHTVTINIKEATPEYIGILREDEVSALEKYMITISNNYDTIPLFDRQVFIRLPATIKSGDILYYINQSDSPMNIFPISQYFKRTALIGPFPSVSIARNNIALLYTDNKPINRFRIDGGYDYMITRDSIKTKKWEKSPINKEIKAYTQSAILSNAHTDKYIKDFFNTNFTYSVKNSTGSMPFFNSTYPHKLVIHNNSTNNQDHTNPVLIYIDYEETPDIIDYLYYGESRQFGDIPDGKATIGLIYDNSTQHTIFTDIKKGGTIHLNFDPAFARPIKEEQPYPLNLLLQHIISNNDKIINTDQRLVTGQYIRENDLKNQITGIVTNQIGVPISNARIWIRNDGEIIDAVTNIKGEFTYPISNSQKHFEISALGYFDPQKLPFIKGYHYSVTLYRRQTMTTVLSTQENPPFINREFDYSNMVPNSPDTVHKNFNDNAFWLPKVSTDKNGRAKIEISYTDDVTQWITNFIIVSKNGETGAVQMKIKTKQSQD